MLGDKRRKRIIELTGKSRERKEQRLYIVDGPRCCEALDPASIQEWFVTEAFLNSANSYRLNTLFHIRQPEVITESEMKSISDTQTPQGVLAVVKMPDALSVKDIAQGDKKEKPLLLVLETIQDPGNLGTMMRAAEAAGVTGILMDETTVDPYSPKVVRSSMSSVFRVPFAVVKDLPETIGQLKEGRLTDGEAITTLATSPSAEQDYCDVDYTKPCAILIGNEAAGLSERLMALAGTLVTIPMKGEIESLNAAMAATVIGFEAARQRRL